MLFLKCLRKPFLLKPFHGENTLIDLSSIVLAYNSVDCSKRFTPLISILDRHKPSDVATSQNCLILYRPAVSLLCKAYADRSPLSRFKRCLKLGRNRGDLIMILSVFLNSSNVCLET